MKHAQMTRAIAYFALLIVLTMAAACNSKPGGKKMKFTLETNMDELVRTMSNDPADTMLNNALEATNEARQTSKTGYVSLFANTFKQKYPGVKLAALFVKMNEPALNANSSDEDVINFLKKEAETAMKQDCRILQQRVTSLGLTKPSIKMSAGLGNILLEVDGVMGDSTEVCNFLSATGQLEFFETYTNEELMPAFIEINDRLKASAAGNMDTSNVKSIFQNKEKYLNPLFYIMMPAIDETNNAINGSIVGRPFRNDTAKLNKLLAQKMVRELLPADLKFVYAHSAKNDNIICLYAIKVPSGGIAIINNEYITDATSAKSRLTEDYCINIEMDKRGAVIWEAMTAKNINHHISVTLDCAIYSCPRVEGVIPSGNTMISGTFTKDQATQLAAVLKCGKLPLPVHIVANSIDIQ